MPLRLGELLIHETIYFYKFITNLTINNLRMSIWLIIRRFWKYISRKRYCIVKNAITMSDEALMEIDRRISERYETAAPASHRHS